MRKLVAVLLVFGLLLLDVTPTLAAGERLNAAVPAQAPAREEVVQVAVPEGVALGESELQNTQGEWWWVVAGVVGGAIAGAVESYAATVKIDAWAVVKSAAAGAAVAAVNPAGALVSETQVFGRTLTAAAKVGKYLRDGAVAGGTAGVLERAVRGRR